jgi:REP element-mobilizing transposase RayT
MPCYHFTFHAFGSWMPDEDDGYVRRGEGVQLPDLVQAKAYRSRMRESEVHFGESEQQLIIDELLIAAEKQGFRMHFVATEPTHIHVLISWTDDRTWEKLRNGIKSSLSRRLRRNVASRRWLSEGGSRRRVSIQEHFDYLVHTYLPRHGGWKWSFDRGTYREDQPEATLRPIRSTHSGGC